MTYTLMTIDGQEFPLPSKKPLPLEFLQAFMRGYIEYVALPNGDSMVINENGKLENMLPNPKATAIFRQAYPIEKYSMNNDELIVGDVVYCKKKGSKPYPVDQGL